MSRNNKLIPNQPTNNNPALNNQQMNRNTQLQGLGFEIFAEQEFVRYPVLGVNQPTSDFKPEGRFHNRVTGESYDSIDVVFIALRRSMAYRPHGYSDPVPACFSSNALRPDAAVEQPVHHTCNRMTPRGLTSECPNARWIRNAEGKARRACDLRYTAAVDFKGEQYLMYFQGRSIAPFEQFLSQLRQLRQPLFGVRVNLGLTYRTKKEGFMGNFYEINFPEINNPSDRERVEVVDALSFQENALFFKEYFETAPSDLYHEGEEQTDKKDVREQDGVQYASASASESSNRANPVEHDF